jgi:hypothetical protein
MSICPSINSLTAEDRVCSLSLSACFLQQPYSQYVTHEIEMKQMSRNSYNRDQGDITCRRKWWAHLLPACTYSALRFQDQFSIRWDCTFQYPVPKPETDCAKSLSFKTPLNSALRLFKYTFLLVQKKPDMGSAVLTSGDASIVAPTLWKSHIIVESFFANR